MNRWIHGSKLVLGLALLSFPRSFRRHHRDDALEYFEARARDAAARGGRPAVLTLLAREVVVTIAGGLLERVAAVARVLPGPSAVLLDIRFGLRSLRRQPSFVLSAVTPLAVAVAGVSAVFAVVDGVVLRPLPYPAPERLVEVGGPRADGTVSSLSTANLIDIERSVSAFEAFGGVTSQVTTLRTERRAELMTISRVSKGFLDVFGLEPAVGRGFSEEDFEAPSVALVTWEAFIRRWAGDLAELGTSVDTEFGTFHLIGVLPPGFVQPEALRGADGELWAPLDYDDPILERTRAFGLATAAARLRPGSTIEAANAELESHALALAEAYPEANRARDGSPKRIEARSLHAETVGDSRGRLAIMLAAVVGLLAIACANVANLFLARGTDRERELALRTVMGAGRQRIFVQLIAESVAVGLVAGGIGTLLAKASLGTLVRLSPELPRASTIALDWRVIAASIAVATVCGIAFGLAPAILRSRREPGLALRGGRSGTRRSERLRGLLVVSQTALAVALVTGGGLLLNSVVRLASVEPGFDAEDVFVFRPRLPQRPLIESDTSPVPFYDELADRLARVPGVEHVGVSMFEPGSTLPVTVSVRARPADDPVRRWRHSVMRDFFESIELPLLEGRLFPRTVRPEDPREAVVSRAFAAELWPEESALGRTFVVEGDSESTTLTVVGVVEDIRNSGPHESPEAVYYESFRQNPWLPSMAVLVDHSGVADIATIAQDILQQVAPTITATGVTTLEDVLASHYEQERYFALLLGLFSSIAVGIAAVGVYATMAYAVARRMREMGVRRAVGAGGAEIMGLIVRRGLAQAAVGVALGLVAAAWSSRLLTAMLFDVSPIDPATYGLVAAILLAVAGLACLAPARRAASVDPVTILRWE